MKFAKKFRPTKLYVLYETFQITGKALGTGITIIVIARFFYLCPPQNHCLNLMQFPALVAMTMQRTFWLKETWGHQARGLQYKNLARFKDLAE